MTSFYTENVGSPSKPHTIIAVREALREFALATNDEDLSALAGDIAPPLFSVVPVYRPLTSAIRAVTPKERMMYTLHGEQDMRFLAPIHPGTTLRAVATPVGIRVKRSGTTISIRAVVDDGGGNALCEQWLSMFIRGAGEGEDVGQAMPSRPDVEASRLGEPFAEVVQHVDSDQTFRFAAASGDPMPVHLDDAVAKQYGLPGIICHGLCTMAFAGNAAIEAVCDGSAPRLQRLAVRFAKPLLPGQDILTRFWRLPHSDGSLIGFETTDEGGQPVLTNGLVVVSTTPTSSG